ncbi:SulP family inorganic anion transporter [Propionivibrio dicarboxylicus]|uniref:Sulfate permease, SulP family n=1 Tax=Propionivibrio dicarboxylicus TaxID=83767 RepID=A0A1G8E5I3_9RHOO|nr:SulP family inorganic anion transporter [Propionivibrio dicarboxylicus]SDH65206.1 sulfate permease, SulP family [Propionivibrio dicarboxylicus]
MREFSGTWMRHSGDFWGGFAAMLVALPASVAFGVTVYAAINPHYAAFGALAGILGATALGLLAPVFGGTDRLISAPCAPAAAVLSAFAIQLVGQGTTPVTIVLLMTVLGILTGLIQMLIGFVGIGGLIKYIPYPVVSGYLSGVGLIIIGSQLPKFAGAPEGTLWYQALIKPELWDLRGLAIGGVTAAAMLLSRRFVKTVPGTIIGIVAGAVTYGSLAALDPSMRVLEGNELVVGELGANGAGYIDLITNRWNDIGEMRLSQVGGLIGSAITLAALLSIDTLKTCVILDQMTRTRHEPNRELAAQGFANAVASTIGGMPGAGTMGATLVNLSSGAQTRMSGIVEGVTVAVVGLVLGAFVAWIPIAALAGVLLVVGMRMIDTDPLRFLESRSTVLDFSVVLAVVASALFIGLIAASAVGVVLSIILFLREQVGGNVVRRKSVVGQRSSTWYRPDAEMQRLEQFGDTAVIFELQGSLFFGTTHQLYLRLEPELSTTHYLILDLQRVQSVDLTAAHMLSLVRDILSERKVPLILSSVREMLPNGRNLREFLELAGLVPDGEKVLFMPSLEAAIEWVEERILGDVGKADATLPPLELHEIGLFKGSKPDTLIDLATCLEARSCKTGDVVYDVGDMDCNLYLVRSGEVRIMGRVGTDVQLHHIATYGRGEFFGGLAFLDHRPRGNSAVVSADAELYVLSMEKFDVLAEEHKRIALLLISQLARTLALRLRHSDQELTLLREN